MGSAFQPAPGTELGGGRYRLRRVLRVGGMGSIVEAEEPAARRLVAVKFVDTSLGDDGFARFTREARLAAEIASPYVVRVHDVGHAADRPYIVMELLNGPSLGEVLRPGVVCSLDEAADNALEAAAGLAAAHALNVVHRDMKPPNLCFHEDERGRHLKVVDFGIAKARRGAAGLAPTELTATHAFLGTPEYMSPEQLRDPRRVDRRSDIFSLGVILYRMLAGVRPFALSPDGSRVAEIASILADTPPPVRSFVPTLPPAIDQLLERMLAKSPDQRPSDLHAVADALLPFAGLRGQRAYAEIQNLPPPPSTVPLAQGSGADGSGAQAAFPGSLGPRPPQASSPAFVLDRASDRLPALASTAPELRRPSAFVNAVAVLGGAAVGFALLALAHAYWPRSGRAQATGEPDAPAAAIDPAPLATVASSPAPPLPTASAPAPLPTAPAAPTTAAAARPPSEPHATRTDRRPGKATPSSTGPTPPSEFTNDRD